MVDERHDTAGCHAVGKVVQTFCRNLGLHEKALDLPLLTLLRVWWLVEGNDDTAALDEGVRTREDFAANQIKHNVDGFDLLLDEVSGKVDDAVCAQT